MSSMIFFLMFVPILSIILLTVNFIFAPHMPYKEKKTPFECGYHSFLSQNRTQFTISFFIFALLFLIFDLEIVLIYPFTVSSYANNIYGLVLMIIFTLIVTVGFIFELGKNALKIESKQGQITESKTDTNKHNSLNLLESSLFPNNSANFKSAIFIALILGLIAFSFKFPIFYIASQLDCSIVRHLVSGIFIFILGGIRMGLQGEFVSFSFRHYKLAIFLWLIVVLLTETGYLDSLVCVIISLLGCVCAGIPLYVPSLLKENSNLKHLTALGKADYRQLWFILNQAFKVLFSEEKQVMTGYTAEDSSKIFPPAVLYMEGNPSGSGKRPLPSSEDNPLGTRKRPLPSSEEDLLSRRKRRRLTPPFQPSGNNLSSGQAIASSSSTFPTLTGFPVQAIPWYGPTNTTPEGQAIPRDNFTYTSPQGQGIASSSSTFPTLTGFPVQASPWHRPMNYSALGQTIPWNGPMNTLPEEQTIPWNGPMNTLPEGQAIPWNGPMYTLPEGQAIASSSSTNPTLPPLAEQTRPTDPSASINPAALDVPVVMDWDTPYNTRKELHVRNMLESENVRLKKIINLMEDNKANSTNHGLRTFLHAKDIRLLAYYHYKRTGSELATTTLGARGRWDNLLEEIKATCSSSDRYLNKLSRIQLEDLFSNPSYIELKLLEKVHVHMLDNNQAATFKSMLSNVTLRTVAVNVLVTDQRTCSVTPVIYYNTFICKLVIEDRIKALRQELNLQE